MEALYSLPVALIVAVASAWITVQLSLRQFRAEKMWEMRVEAYRTVIEALHDAKELPSAEIDADIRGGTLADDRRNELVKKLHDASDRISMAIDSSGFLISKEARARLAKYQADSAQDAHHANWQLFIEREWSVVDDCLRDLIEIARRDLKIK